MKVMINYADEKYRKTQKINTKTAYKIAGFDKVIEYSPSDIDKKFYADNKNILDKKRGNGLWLWKPYFILKTLESLNDNDILLYCDSGAFWIKNAKPIFDIIERESVFVSNIPLVEKQFTKKYSFEFMDCNIEIIQNSNQMQAGILGFKKNDYTISFVKEWLKACTNEKNLSSELENIGIDETYIAHREDQSVLSLLCKKKNISAHLDPTQFGKLPQKYQQSKYIFIIPKHDDKYKPMLVLHRTKDVNKKVCFKQWLCCVLPKFISINFISGRRIK